MSTTIRRMTITDVPVGMRLKELAGWNQTAADWQRFLRLQPDGCFLAEVDGQGVGTATAFIFDNVAWIAMVLVDPSYRKHGIGTALMSHALTFLGNRTVRLDATALGQPVYAKLGFIGEYELTRYEGTLADRGPIATTVRTVNIESACRPFYRLDQQITGTDRTPLLIELAKSSGLRAVAEAGYLMDRPGSRATQIGPAIARDEASGLALFNDAARRLAGQPVLLDIPTDNRPAIGWAEAAGLKVQRTFLRMRRGPALVDYRQQIWAGSGPEKG